MASFTYPNFWAIIYNEHKPKPTIYSQVPQTIPWFILTVSYTLVQPTDSMSLHVYQVNPIQVTLLNVLSWFSKVSFTFYFHILILPLPLATSKSETRIFYDSLCSSSSHVQSTPVQSSSSRNWAAITMTSHSFTVVPYKIKPPLPTYHPRNLISKISILFFSWPPRPKTQVHILLLGLSYLQT